MNTEREKEEKAKEIKKIVRLLWLLDMNKLKNIYILVLYM